jgi:hypothetical protein
LGPFFSSVNLSTFASLFEKICQILDMTKVKKKKKNPFAQHWTNQVIYSSSQPSNQASSLTQCD